MTFNLSSQRIKELALSAGFSHCGIARACELGDARRRFESSLQAGRQAEMHFLEKDVDKRFNPALLLDNCQSVIVLLFDYRIAEQPASDRYRTARYTWIEEDYHTLLKRLAMPLVEDLESQQEGVQCRITVDSSCISEKNWAQEAGVGCYGKNGLIHNAEGSFYVIATILVNATFDCYDEAQTSDCGDCHLCMDACPANALSTPYCVDARRCFAYHTVENKQADDETLKQAPLIFGCDVCQEVCPKNKKKTKPASDNPKTSLFLHLQNEQLENLTREEFKHYFGNTAIARRKYDRFCRAIELKKKNPQ